MSVRLDRLYCISPGEFVELPILLENRYPSYLLGGYDFIVEYDSRLIFSQADPGDLLTDCGWEYFTYSTSTPSSVRLIAIAETNNGPNHPTCFADSSGTLALLKFQISSDYTYIDEYLPVWWSWGDCGDNTLSSHDGNQLYISDSVYYFDGDIEHNITQESSFPTPYGASNECIAASTPTPLRKIDFFSGGFDISPSGFQVHCPSDIVAPNDSGSCGAVITFEIPLNSDCPGATSYSTPPSGSFFPLGSTTVTTVASDDLGHTDFCYFTITVEDKEPPQMICQSDTTLYTTTGEWWTQLEYDFSATDFCSGVALSSSHPSGSYFSIGVTNVYCVATDSLGNADTTVFSVTVVDNEPPTLQCPDTIILSTENELCGATVDFIIEASDNSMQVSVTTSLESGSFLEAGTTIVSATASDPYGNSDSCSFAIIIEDREPPQITCPSNILLTNDLGSCGAMVDFNVTATDNCGAPTLEYSDSPNTFFPIGSTLVIAAATDMNQNIDSCQFYIVVQDNEPPLIDAPNYITIPTDFNQCGAIVDFSYTATDNCDGFVVSTTLESGSFLDVGTTLVVLQIIDIAGFIDTDSFTVVIEDLEPPFIETYLDLSVMSDSGYYGSYVEYAPLVSDNCQLNLMTIEPQSGSYFELGQSKVAVTAYDIHGNFDSSSFFVNVLLQDVDNDMVADFEDNCLSVSNPNQEDANADGIGDACCCVGIRGNIDGSNENPPSDNGIDISDIVFLVSYMFGTQGGLAPSCPAEADINGSGQLDVSDIVFIIGYMFGGSGIAPNNCP